MSPVFYKKNLIIALIVLLVAKYMDRMVIGLLLQDIERNLGRAIRNWAC